MCFPWAKPMQIVVLGGCMQGYRILVHKIAEGCVCVCVCVCVDIHVEVSRQLRQDKTKASFKISD